MGGRRLVPAARSPASAPLPTSAAASHARPAPHAAQPAAVRAGAGRNQSRHAPSRRHCLPRTCPRHRARLREMMPRPGSTSLKPALPAPAPRPRSKGWRAAMPEPTRLALGAAMARRQGARMPVAGAANPSPLRCLRAVALAVRPTLARRVPARPVGVVPVANPRPMAARRLPPDPSHRQRVRHARQGHRPIHRMVPAGWRDRCRQPRPSLATAASAVRRCARRTWRRSPRRPICAQGSG